ncbi:MAG: hypothetical protein QOK26_893 [Pseudonocardiales bacterium]|jgi:hypothetical protein|nr:hypothetical protein [Pseudonocardiales bacterium]MDT7648000.1 hypothetical protein [Pseudonocardiales bacterium]MDT7696074.1 hypothetical protein [Pseudonocardiales bacterium]
MTIYCYVGLMPSMHACPELPSGTPTVASPPAAMTRVFVHFANRDTGTGREAGGVLGRFVTAPLAGPDEVARELGCDRVRADTLSDALTDAAFERGFFARLQRHSAWRARFSPVESLTR